MKIVGLLILVATLFGSTNFGDRALRPGHWGGMEIELTVLAVSSDVELDCAHGMIMEQFSVDRYGHFDLAGTYESGPVVLPPPFRPAHYVGDVNGKTMRLMIRLDDTGETVGPFHLTRGVVPVIIKCL
jgi:hypothetical protein